MGKKIFFGNYKGGVGKTTTVFEIGALLAENHNKKVLLIDLDPQCSLSKICSKVADIDLNSLNIEETLNFAIELYVEYVKWTDRTSLLINDIRTDFNNIRKSIKTIPKYSRTGGTLDYIPTVLNLKNTRLNDIADRMSEDTKNVIAIAKLIDDINLQNQYDYILFDCPPTSNIITQGIFNYCDYYLIPTIVDEISCDGVPDYVSEIHGAYLKYTYDNNVGGLLLKRYFGEKPELIGVLRTMFKNRRGSDSTLSIVKTLDLDITAVGAKSIIDNTPYVEEGMKNIFKEVIEHSDNRTNPNNYGVPITVSQGEIHEKYINITKIINEII